MGISTDCLAHKSWHFQDYRERPQTAKSCRFARFIFGEQTTFCPLCQLEKDKFFLHLTIDLSIGARGGGQGGATDPQKKFGEDQIRASSSGRIGKNKFLSVIKTEKFSKIGNDEQEFGY